MANRLKLYVDWRTGVLRLSDKRSEIVQVPPFKKYDTVPMEVVLIEPDPSYEGQWTRLDVSGITLNVALHSAYDTASPLCQQTTWTRNEDDNYLYADFALNTTTANSYIGSTAVVYPYFEIEVVEGTYRKKAYVAQVEFRQGVQQVTTVSPAPANEYYTKAESNGLYIQAIAPAGATLTLTSPNGAYRRVVGIGDDGVPYDNIETV